ENRHDNNSAGMLQARLPEGHARSESSPWPAVEQVVPVGGNAEESVDVDVFTHEDLVVACAAQDDDLIDVAGIEGGDVDARVRRSQVQDCSDDVDGFAAAATRLALNPDEVVGVAADDVKDTIDDADAGQASGCCCRARGAVIIFDGHGNIMDAAGSIVMA